MTGVAVDRILASRDYGTVFSGVDGAGGRTIVTVAWRTTVAVGESYEVEGRASTWVDERGGRHGRVEATRLTRTRTSGALLSPWLRTVRGVGPARARRLLERWGADLPDVLSDPARIPEIAAVLDARRPVLAAKLAAFVHAGFIERIEDERTGIAEARFRVDLEMLGIDDPSVARQLWRLLGGIDAWERLKERPYAVAGLLPWKVVDGLARRLTAMAAGRPGTSHPDERSAGACDSVVREILAAGNTAVSMADALRMLGARGVPAPRALECGIKRGKLLPLGGYLLAPGAGSLETTLLRDLAGLRDAVAVAPSPAGPRDRVLDAERTAGLELTAEQRDTVGALLAEGVGILQGGAGVGKTTVTKVLVEAWRARGGQVVMAALSGKAALRLSVAAGAPAATIARLLRGLAEREELIAAGRLAEGRNGDAWTDGGGRRVSRDRPVGTVRPFPPKLTGTTMLVLDEASMIDLCSLHGLVRRMPPGARLILVGDQAQLPPVGLGQCYHDLVGAARGVHRLETVLRQTAGNPLISVALAIRSGIVPDLPAFTGRATGVQLLACDAASIDDEVRRASRIVGEGIPAAQRLILAGLRGTVRRINQAETASRVSEGAEGVRLGPLCPWVSVGDPVVMSRNHYRAGLMNGETGILASLDPPAILWGSDPRPTTVDDETRGSIELAWAITGHRSQGSEVSRVVIALDGSGVLSRQWLYTVLTRAVDQAVLVGPVDVLRNAVGRLEQRITGFGLMLPSAARASA